MAKRLMWLPVVAVVLITGGCASESAAIIEHAEAIEAVVLAYEDAWAPGDADLIASVLDDGFVFNEPGSRDLDRDEFMNLMLPFIGNPAIGSTDVHLFVGEDEAILVSQAWGFGGGTSEGNPVVEVDVFTMSDGAITSIRSMYGAEFVWKYAGIKGAEESVAAYESAWSSGDASELEALYADDAVRSEPLYGNRLQGADEIAQEALDRIAQDADLSIDVVEPFVFASADNLAQTFGAMYAVGTESTCKVLVLLEPSDEGEIMAERVYFHTETLGSCDW